MDAGGLVWGHTCAGWNRAVKLESFCEKRGEAVGIHPGGTPHGHRHYRGAGDADDRIVEQCAEKRPEGSFHLEPAADSGGVQPLR